MKLRSYAILPSLFFFFMPRCERGIYRKLNKRRGWRRDCAYTYKHKYTHTCVYNCWPRKGRPPKSMGLCGDLEPYNTHTYTCMHIHWRTQMLLAHARSNISGFVRSAFAATHVHNPQPCSLAVSSEVPPMIKRSSHRECCCYFSMSLTSYWNLLFFSFSTSFLASSLSFVVVSWLFIVPKTFSLYFGVSNFILNLLLFSSKHSLSSFLNISYDLFSFNNILVTCLLISWFIVLYFILILLKSTVVFRFMLKMNSCKSLRNYRYFNFELWKMWPLIFSHVSSGNWSISCASSPCLLLPNSNTLSRRSDEHFIYIEFQL